MTRTFTVNPDTPGLISEIGELLDKTLIRLQLNGWNILNIIDNKIQISFEGKYYDALQFIIIASIEDNNGWVSVKENPEKNGFYNVVVDGEIAGEDKPFVSISEFKDNKWVDEAPNSILYWQPFPDLPNEFK